MNRFKKLTAGTALMGISVASTPVFAQTGTNCLGDDNCEEPRVRGKMLDDGSVGDVPAGENTERAAAGDEAGFPFAVSVDGRMVAQSTDRPSRAGAQATGSATLQRVESDPSVRSVDRQRKTDIELQAVDIQIKYDGLQDDPVLNVSTLAARRRYRAGEPVTFLATANYPAFIDRSEIRIYRQGESRARRTALAVLPIEINGEVQWTMPTHETVRDFTYVLRVYDRHGRYDETAPLTLSRTEREDVQPAQEEAAAPGMGEDTTAVRNIPVRGGAVTVYGRNVPPGHKIEAFGEYVPLDPDRSFVVQRILPPGDHDVDVSVNSVLDSSGLHFSRYINIPQNDWFYVGLADLTVGKRMGDDDIETVRPGEYDEIYSKGRLAFYLKGKIRGEYLLTAAADTTAEDLEDLFRNLDEKDPRQLLRKLDPDDYYPVYGDDSTLVEDAPTKGKFYVRLERGDSRVMWGNYRTRVTGTEFLRAERGLYGASAVYRSEESMSFGERRTDVRLYAAQPDTLPQRDEFRATGGSAYFLKRQQIIEGSETVTIEIRNDMTDRVTDRQLLLYGEDYSIDYLQGVIILRRPLSSFTGTDGPVRDGALGGNHIYLTVQYEYEPLATDIDGYAYGGRAQHWLNEKVRVGVTGLNEGTAMADQEAIGVDMRMRHSETTFLDAEIAHTQGPGFGFSRSTDGGLTLSDTATAGSRERAADAWRLEGQVDLEDISDGGASGIVGGYHETKEANFSTLYDQVLNDQRIWGGHADLELTERTGLRLTYDDYRDDGGQVRRDGTSSLEWELDERWKASSGITYTELMSPLAIRSGKGGYNGSRVDAGVRIEYRRDDDQLHYVFGQGTLDRSDDISRNDRVGVGTEFQLSQAYNISAEISYGTHGVGALAALNYNPTADNHYYVGYRLDPDRAFDLDRNYDLLGADKGEIVTGMRRRVGDEVSTYAEGNYDMFGRRRTLTQSYGVVYTPGDRWTFDVGLQGGRVRDDTIQPGTGRQRADFDRYAPSLSIGYANEEAGIDSLIRGEMRIEDSEDGSRDQNSYLLAAGLSWKADEAWRLLTSIDAVLSESASTATSFRDTHYTEASIGSAYRPVDNDRLNVLSKYTWLYDMPGNNQLVSGATGDVYAPAQRSHIFSVDGTYDLVPWLSIGGKYGSRYGDVKYRTRNGIGDEFEESWQRSTAHLGIVRSDFHIVKEWDVLLEGRMLHMHEARTTDLGALAAIYRHIGSNFKAGVGYNFGSFSDDLRDLTLNDKGVFFKIVGKF